jgi:hypothetical protein
MTTFIHTADGSKTSFASPSNSLNKITRVNGVPVAVPTANISLSAVTLSAAPKAGDIVEVFTAPFNGVDPALLPFTLEASTTPALLPVVQYHGAGADLLSFVVEAKATKMDIFAKTAQITY